MSVSDTEVIGIGAASAPAQSTARPAFHTDSRHFAQNAKAPLEFGEALKRARQLLATPEQLYGTDEGRRIIEALVIGYDTSQTFTRAQIRGDDVFCLVKQDRCAPFAIRAWAEIAGRHGSPVAKVHEALAMAERWDNTTTQRKWPD